MQHSRGGVWIVVCSLAACSESTPPPVPTSTAIVTVAERYVTASDPAMNIDSVATHGGPNDVTWLFATAKEGDVVRIYDATSGAFIRDLGGVGVAPGQFERPNGIIAQDGLLIVVERDNRRVQIFNLPALEPVAMFGQAELAKPYGAYVHKLGDDLYELFVTDAYETADEQVPPEAELDRRVHAWSLRVARGADGSVQSVVASHERAFGATSGPGVLRVVESIWGDPVNDRLMVAEEDPAGGRVLKVYSLTGQFRSEIVGEGLFQVQPEGIGLYECTDGGGYWITTDQDLGRNVFHLFDRQTLRHAGAFQGAVTRNTDGIWLAQRPFAGFPAGALFAVHDDQAVAAFDWRDIVAAIGLSEGCAGT